MGKYLILSVFFISLAAGTALKAQDYPNYADTMLYNQKTDEHRPMTPAYEQANKAKPAYER